MTQYETRYCPTAARPLPGSPSWKTGATRRACAALPCGWTHWNNPTPVLAAIVEVNGQVLLARNAAWPEKMFALITGFMEAGESPQEGIAREVKKKPTWMFRAPNLWGLRVLRMNQVIIAYHVVATGQVKLSPELVDYRLYDLDKLKCWHAGTGYALADWLRTEGTSQCFTEEKCRAAPWAGPAEQGLMTMETHKEIDTRGLNCPLPILKAKGLGRNGQRPAVEGGGHRCGVGARLPGVCQTNGQ